jgi:hypothetical protein
VSSNVIGVPVILNSTDFLGRSVVAKMPLPNFESLTITVSGFTLSMMGDYELVDMKHISLELQMSFQ